MTNFQTTQTTQTMPQIQTGILQTIPQHACYLTFSFKPSVNQELISLALTQLAQLVDGDSLVLGLGSRLIKQLHSHIDGMKTFNGIEGSQIDLPITPSDLWCWCRGNERGEFVHQMHRIIAAVEPAFLLDESIDAFKYGSGRDLTGYEDGTENPVDQAAIDAAFVQSGPLAGSSFVAALKWRHQFDRFHAMSQTQQDHTIGRRISDNEEIDDAPESAHVKRTAQEDFSPEAFILRRAMPWSYQADSGLYFVAFGKSFDAFEALLTRMVGAEDGIVDALYSISTPISGAYYWCPPMKAGRIDFSALNNLAATI